MSIIGDLFVKLGLKDDGFNQGIDNAQKKTGAFGSAMGKLGGIIAGVFAVGAIINFGKTSMEEFNKAEQGAMRLLIALKGNRQAQEELITVAKARQSVTLYEDDETIAAQAAMAMLIKEADKIRELTPLVQDLATAKGIDLTSAGFMVAKAVEGSGAALQKMGIQVEGTAGSTERFTSVMNGLNKAVGGQAKAAADVGTGALTQLVIAFGNLKEVIGGGIAESGAFKGSVKNITGYIEDVTAIMESKYIPKWKKFWWIISGKTGGAATIEADQKALDAKWNAELHPAEKQTTEKTKTFIEAEQIVDRIKQLKKDIADTRVEMSLLSGSTPEWKTKADELKGFQEELDGLTGATKAQEEADKLATDAKSALIDRMIAQRVEEQKIMALRGEKVTTTDKGILLQELSPKGGGSVASGLATPAVAGLQAGNTTENAITAAKEAELLAIQEKNTKIEDEERRFNDSLQNLISGGMQAAAVTFGVGIGNLMTGDMNIGEFGASLLGAVASFMVQFGEQMIALATANAVLALTMSNPLSWPLMLAAGIAVVAAGTALANVSKKGLSGGSGGGGSSAASGYSNSQSQSTAKEALSGNVSFEIQGNKLVGVLNNQDRRNLNFK